MHAVNTEFDRAFLGTKVVTERNHHFQAGKTGVMRFVGAFATLEWWSIGVMFPDSSNPLLHYSTNPSGR